MKRMAIVAAAVIIVFLVLALGRVVFEVNCVVPPAVDRNGYYWVHDHAGTYVRAQLSKMCR